MRNSYLVRRFFTLLIAAVILWTVLTIVFYTFVAQPVFTRIKVGEILPRAERLLNEHSPAASGGVVTPFSHNQYFRPMSFTATGFLLLMKMEIWSLVPPCRKALKL